MRVDESIANCQVSAEEGYYLECDYQSAAYRCEKHQVPKVLVCIWTAVRYYAVHEGKIALCLQEPGHS